MKQLGLLLSLLLLFPLTVHAVAFSSTEWEHSVTSSTQSMNAVDSNGSKISSIAQSLQVDYSKVFSVPSLGYIHTHTHGVDLKTSLDSNGGINSAYTTGTYHTTQSGRIMIKDLNYEYSYTGTYDGKGNYTNSFNLSTLKDFLLYDKTFLELRTGYVADEPNVILDNKAIVINTKDIFYSGKLSYNLGSYQFGVAYTQYFIPSFTVKDIKYQSDIFSVFATYKF
jgi:hypothetical protein